MVQREMEDRPILPNNYRNWRLVLWRRPIMVCFALALFVVPGMPKETPNMFTLSSRVKRIEGSLTLK
jgi:hypothetical protein